MPATSAELPKHVPYLLIGGGTAAFSAFRAIKSNDPRAKVSFTKDKNTKGVPKNELFVCMFNIDCIFDKFVAMNLFCVYIYK